MASPPNWRIPTSPLDFFWTPTRRTCATRSIPLPNTKSCSERKRSICKTDGMVSSSCYRTSTASKSDFITISYGKFPNRGRSTPVCATTGEADILSGTCSPSTTAARQQPTGEFDERTPEFDRQFDNLSGAVGATYQLNPKNLFKLHLGNSFRFPTAIELSSNGVHHGNFRHERGDPNLVMERGYQADLTYLRSAKNISLEISAFYGYYTDYIYLSPTGNFSPLASGGTLWQYRQDDAVFNGFEVAGRYLLPIGLQLDLSGGFRPKPEPEQSPTLTADPAALDSVGDGIRHPVPMENLERRIPVRHGPIQFCTKQNGPERKNDPRQLFTQRGSRLFGKAVRPGYRVQVERKQSIEYGLFQSYQ